MQTFPRGSEWRKWDLHFHTPSSYDYENGAVTDEEIIQVLKANNIAAVAITDHHLIDTERIKRLRSLSRGEVTIFPGIELRSEYGGSESVHFIGIFADDVDVDYIWDKIKAPLNLTPVDIKKKGGDDRISCDFKEATKIIKNLGGIVSIHSGRKSNSVECISNALSYKQAIKEEIAENVDLYEVGQLGDVEEYREKVFPNIKKELPLVIGSDNHNVKKYKCKEYCWIKADPTFQGLKHILAEPSDRVFLGDVPPKLLDIQSNKSKYIDRIEVIPIDAKESPAWFNGTIPLNSELVAIIGKKGSGKSALADIIAVAGRSQVPIDMFSFLHKQKFWENRTVAAKYETKITWMDGKQEKVKLDQHVAETDYEKVKYLPQKHVENLCNEFGVRKEFQKEINQIVFTYVDPSEKLGAANLEELISKKTAPIEQQLQTLRAKLLLKIDRFITLEQKKEASYLESLENKLGEKRRELENLKDSPKVQKPKQEIDEKTTQEIKGTTDKIAKLETQITDAKTQLAVVNSDLQKITNIESKLLVLQQGYTETKSELDDDLKKLGLNFDEIVTYKIEKTSLSAKKRTLTEKKMSLSGLLDVTDTQSLVTQKISLEKVLAGITAQLDSQNKLYQQYLRSLKIIEDKRIAIQGKPDDTNPETVTVLQREIKYIKELLDAEITEAKNETNAVCGEIFKKIREKVRVYEEVYAPLKECIDDQHERQKTAKSVLDFGVNVVFDEETFIQNFLSFIHQGRRGNFSGTVDGRKHLIELIRSSNLRNVAISEDNVIRFIDAVLDSLNSKKLRNEGITLDKQIREGVTRLDLYKFLYKITYLDVEYKVTFNGKDLNENKFSPGEKGALLLIFYLLIDKGKNPLIIDQPEENLDNESVFELLVPYVKEAKKQRQIIIVTHNPNLAVVCDAEQIIHAKMDKATHEIRYESGSIEHAPMNIRASDILEGTLKAFRIRDGKYIKPLKI